MAIQHLKQVIAHHSFQCDPVLPEKRMGKKLKSLTIQFLY